MKTVQVFQLPVEKSTPENLERLSNKLQALGVLDSSLILSGDTTVTTLTFGEDKPDTPAVPNATPNGK